MSKPLDPSATPTKPEPEGPGVLVCMRKGSLTPFLDNETATCGICGSEVFYRPHAPRDKAKVCDICFIEAGTNPAKRIGPLEGYLPETATCVITRETIKEIEAWAEKLRSARPQRQDGTDE